MSIKWLAKVWELPLKDASKKLVLLALADFANDQGWCWPSYTTLAAKCSLSRRAVIRAINQLVEEGFVLKVSRDSADTGYLSNQFQVTIPKQTKKTKPGDSEAPPSDPVTLASDNVSLKWCQGDTRVVSLCHYPSDKGDTSLLYINRHKNRHITVNEPSNIITQNNSSIDQKGIANDQQVMIEQKFDQFWALYPRRVARTKAKKAFLKIVQDCPEIADEILSGIEQQLPQFASRDVQYIPHPATWINQERWKDQITPQITGDPHERTRTQSTNHAEALWQMLQLGGLNRH